ncbi:MAG: hypothetical protein ACLQNE_28360 [Thermoguttaceae bacterium]
MKDKVTLKPIPKGTPQKCQAERGYDPAGRRIHCGKEAIIIANGKPLCRECFDQTRAALDPAAG